MAAHAAHVRHAVAVRVHAAQGIVRHPAASSKRTNTSPAPTSGRELAPQTLPHISMKRRLERECATQVQV